MVGERLLQTIDRSITGTTLLFTIEALTLVGHPVEGILPVASVSISR